MILKWKGEMGMSHEAVVQQYSGHVSSYQKNGSNNKEKKPPKKDRIHLICFHYRQYGDHCANKFLYEKDGADKLKALGPHQHAGKNSPWVWRTCILRRKTTSELRMRESRKS